LKRLWPLNQKNREAKIAQFAAEYGLRLRFYRKGLCAIFDEWPRSAPLSSKRERARLRSPPGKDKRGVDLISDALESFLIAG
jgi:hypothetical protein